MTKKLTKARIERKARFKTNPEMVELIREVKKQKSSFWMAVANQLSMPKTRLVEINLERLNKLTKAKDIVLVPGKVLGKGTLDHELTLACFKITAEARQRIGKTKLVKIKDLLKEKPSNIKLII